MPANKQPGAFRTIGELSQELGVAQHILRYWETKFPQLKPLQRAGNRRYYRPADVELARKIHHLLSKDGYTVRGVQQLLRNGVETETPRISVKLSPLLRSGTVDQGQRDPASTCSPRAWATDWREHSKLILIPWGTPRGKVATSQVRGASERF